MKFEGKEPETKAEYIARFRQITKSNVFTHQDGHDWPALFLEWIMSEPKDFPTISIFGKSKGIHPISWDKRGGRTFWNKARQAARMEGISKMLQKAPDKIAARMENLVRVQDKLERAIEKLADRVLRELDEEEVATDDPKADKEARRSKTSFNARIMDSLKDIQNGLADVNAKIGGNPQAGAGQVQINLYDTIVESLRERDAKNGVIDVEADRSDS